MTQMFENAIVKFQGLKQDTNPIVVKPDTSIEVYARELEALRPMGGMLRKVLGSDKHSVMYRKGGNRPVVLIRFSNIAATKFFIGTMWDAVMKYSGGTWTALNSDEAGDLSAPRGFIAFARFPDGVQFGHAVPRRGSGQGLRGLIQCSVSKRVWV